MNVGNISMAGATSYIAFTSKVNQSNKAYESAVNKNEDIEKIDVQAEQKDPIMDLYKSICEKYSDVSFRLTDMNAEVEYEKKNGTNCCPWLGYNNSMNQIGDNFGKMSQKSVEIDATVLKKSLEDPNYRENFMAYLDDSLTDTRYNEWRSMAYEQGATNMCLGFIDENGKLTKCATNANCEFSTEEQIKSMWKNDSFQDELLEKVLAQKAELLDNYMKILSEHSQALREKLIGNETNINEQIFHFDENGKIRLSVE